MDGKTAVAFTKSFDPKNKSHVVWWKMLCDNMDTDPIRILKCNPMDIPTSDKDVLDLVFIQFSVAMKYAKATLIGEFWSPAMPHTLET